MDNQPIKHVTVVQQEEIAKKVYHTPKVSHFGSISEITKGGGGGTYMPSDSPTPYTS
jgi:hypothetical protein